MNPPEILMGEDGGANSSSPVPRVVDWEGMYKLKEREFVQAYQSQQDELAAKQQEIQHLQGQVMGLTTRPVYIPQPPSSSGVPEQRKLPPGLKFNNLEPFYGKKNLGLGEDVKSWLFIAEEQFSLWDVTLDSTKIAMAGSAFRADAKQWYFYIRGNPHGAMNNCTWEDFKRLLKQTFMPPDPIRLARDKLSTLYQDSDLRSYNTEFRRLMLIIQNMHEEDKVDRYLRGLKTWVRREVDLRAGNERITKLDDAIALADKVDLNNQYNRSTQARPPSQPKPHFHVPRHHYQQKNDRRADDPMELDALQLQRNEDRRSAPQGQKPRPKGPLPPAERERRIKEGLCMYCGSNKHKLETCPLKRPSGKGQGRPQGSARN